MSEMFQFSIARLNHWPAYLISVDKQSKEATVAGLYQVHLTV